MRIAIASDHAGFSLKQALVRFFQKNKILFQDFGVEAPESVDYPDYAEKVARSVAQGHCEVGVLVCGTGQGMAITANKIQGIRAAVVSDVYSARMAKEHNNANVLALGGRVVDPAKAIRLMKAWLSATYQKTRHQKRLDKISKLEGES